MTTDKRAAAIAVLKALRAERDAARTDLANINSALAEAEPMRQHGSACERIRDLNGARQTAVTIAAQYAIERDAALAAQNARAVEELEKVLTLIRDEWREADTTQCLKSWVDGWLRDRLTVLGAVVDLDRQTEPAAEPVPAAAEDDGGDSLLPCPFCGGQAAIRAWAGDYEGGHFVACLDGRCGASTDITFSVKDDARPLVREKWNQRVRVPAAADAKPGDARRSLVQEDHNVYTPDLGMALINAIDGLDERLRALEVRP